jgi:hypothetical protein
MHDYAKSKPFWDSLWKGHFVNNLRAWRWRESNPPHPERAFAGQRAESAADLRKHTTVITRR